MTITTSVAPTQTFRPLSAAEKRGVVIALALVICIALYASLAGYYAVTTLRDVLILGILAFSLNFLWGRAGLPSFGQGAFFGLGGYSYALCSIHLGPHWGPILGLAAALLAGGLSGLFLGWFLLRAGVRGPLFLIVTVALTQIAQQVALSWSSVTGADGGLIGVPPLSLGDLTLDDPLEQCLFVLLLAGALVAVTWLVCRGRAGRILAAVVSNERRENAIGINSSFVLTLALVASSAVAALAGAIFVSTSSIMVPDLAGPMLSIDAVVWVLVGGLGSLLGPFVGTLIMWRLSQELSSLDPRLWQFFVGLFLIALVFLVPGGTAGFLKRLKSTFAARVRSGSAQ